MTNLFDKMNGWIWIRVTVSMTRLKKKKLKSSYQKSRIKLHTENRKNPKEYCGTGTGIFYRGTGTSKRISNFTENKSIQEKINVKKLPPSTSVGRQRTEPEYPALFSPPYPSPVPRSYGLKY